MRQVADALVPVRSGNGIQFEPAAMPGPIRESEGCRRRLRYRGRIRSQREHAQGCADLDDTVAAARLLRSASHLTEAQLTRLPTVRPRLVRGCDREGREQMLMLFGASTTRDAAYAFYNRVAGGEFGTSKHRLILVPAKDAQER